MSGDGLAFVAGFVFGLVGGIVPGLHSNTIISILVSLGLDERMLAIMIISLFPAHMVSSFIPSIFFGIPESDTVATVLPGQRMVLRGEGLAALRTVLLSCAIAAVISVLMSQLSIEIFSIVYGAIKTHMKYILLAISAILLARSKKPHLAAFVFVLAGLLGHFSLNSKINDPFLPLFSGMFAMAAIVNYKKSKIPEQKDGDLDSSFIKFSILGVGLGMLSDLIPGVGSPSQVATFATILIPINTLSYLATISSISVSQAIFSLSTYVSIDKSRVGATAVLSKQIDISSNFLFLLLLFVLSMSIAILVVYSIRKQVAKLASLDFSKLNSILAIYLIAITWIIDGFLGVGILFVASGLGWLTLKMEVERTNLMGAIIVPTLLLLFGVFF